MFTRSNSEKSFSRVGRGLLFVGLFAISGCGTIDGLVSFLGAPSGIPGVIAQKAALVAGRIGGSGGFGGETMSAYQAHAPMFMGFLRESDLAAPGGLMMVDLANESGMGCMFHLSSFASQLSATEQTTDVFVAAGEVVTIQMPCSEIIGMGPLEEPGEPGCHLDDGLPVSNTMAVPGFMGMDYNCGGRFEFRLMPDVNDLDGDSDRQELIIVSMAMEQHMRSGFPMGMGSMMGGMGRH
ncbi:MAG: hypothetical protein B6D36_15855 [Planctomycetes bacterium UTPLA1]|jgi:hypothetical protein|nr:MAG: hypothetical protein B6D36_15855 [Planctomycetes bacterium UTPLA1]